jgi:hypothetical protein
MPHPLLDDPFVAQEIDAALQPYAHALSAAELAWMRDQLAETLANDPDARRVLDAAHPRNEDVDESGERLRLGATARADEPEEKAG